jgi:hypothetical protein
LGKILQRKLYIGKNTTGFAYQKHRGLPIRNRKSLLFA